MRSDTIPMPVESLLDKLARTVGHAPFKCRVCRAKFYRRARPIPAAPSAVVESAPAPSAAERRRDRADTLRRLDNIIRKAELRRLPRA